MQDSQFNQIKYDNLLEKLRFNINQSDIFMSNKYFNIINELQLTEKISSAHCGFVYSYMYLQSYMCRNTTYDNFIPTVSEIKEIFGYKESNKTINYLIKKNGILDSEKLTITDNNFPIINSYNKEMDILEFDLASDIHPSLKDYREMYNIASTTKYKYPVLSFYDSHDTSEVSVSYKDMGGTFYNVSNTTRIRFEIFAFCMAHSEIGDTGFYLYSYIKHMNDLFNNDDSEYKATSETISKKTGLPERTVKRYLKILREYNLITGIHNMNNFVLGIDKSKRSPNSYLSNTFEHFLFNPMKVDMMKVMSRREYYKKDESIPKDTVIDDISLLL